MKKRILRTLFLSLVALIIGGLVTYTQISLNSRATVQQKGSRDITPVAGVSIGGAYDLIDHNGAPRTDADFTGQYKLIYFGFTYCPAICPTELQKISAVMAKLPAETAANIQPLFITIDPERDTVEAIKDYLSLFHEKFIGLTGSKDQIDAAKKAYRVYARAVQDDTMGDYTMDHSSYIYFMSPDDKLLGMYRIKDTPDYMITDMKKFL